MSVQSGRGWLSTGIAGLALVAFAMVGLSLYRISPALLSVDAYAARVGLHVLLLAISGAAALSSSARALRDLRTGDTAWTALHAPIGSEREIRRAA